MIWIIAETAATDVNPPLVIAIIVIYVVGFIIEWRTQGNLWEKDKKAAEANNYQI